MIGRVFDNRYEIIRKLGTGGMAEVYLAHDRHLDRDVALKLLLGKYASDEQFIERFRREASSAASLNHPNIVQIYDRGEGEGTYYIAMEYLDGRALKEIIVRFAPLRSDHVISMATQILEALRFAHRKDVIHRDIKPQNIIVDDEGRLKVTDFGIARAGSVSTMTETGSILGTAHYLSPEQAQGGHVEAGSDLYSLGIVMYEMATGQLPFTGDNPVAIAMQHVHEAPRPPHELVPDIPLNLERVILRALAKDPAQRYLTAQAFLDELKVVKEGGEIAAPPSFTEQETRVMGALPGPVEPTQIRRSGGGGSGRGGSPEYPAARRRRSAWPWILLVMFVLLLGGGAYALNNVLGSRATGSIVVPNFVNKTMDQAVTQAKSKSLQVVKGGADESSPTVAIGKIARQDPAAGEPLAANSVVKVWLSSGVAMVKVPSLVDKTQADADAAVTKLGLVLDPHPEASADKAAGIVFRQDPAADKQVKAGSSVSVWVSSGPTALQVAVPLCVGLNQDDAVNLLTQAKLVPKIQAVPSDQPGGYVVSQSPQAQTNVAQGSQVVIMVSNSPIQVKVVVPDVRGWMEADAKNYLKIRGLKVSTTPRTDATHPAGFVLEQSPGGNAEVEQGTTVYLVIAEAPPTTTTTAPTTTTEPTTTTTEPPVSTTGT